MVAGSIISAIGFQFLWYGHTFYDFAIYEIIIGIGLSLQSGCDIAILYQSLEKLRLHGSGAGYLGRRLNYSTTGEAIASLFGGFFGGISLFLPAYVQAGVAWIPMFIAMSLYEPEGQKLSSASHIQNFRMIGKAVFGHSKLLTFTILAFIFYGFATFVAVWSMQPYRLTRGLSISLFGYHWAANNLLVAFVGRYVYLVERRLGSVAIVIIIALLPVIGYFGMAFTPRLWGVGLCDLFSDLPGAQSSHSSRCDQPPRSREKRAPPSTRWQRSECAGFSLRSAQWSAALSTRRAPTAL